ncbi:DUF397 domain-containing protein [Nocardia vermiculata]|uniref:DUF397 domain-containing protein n=1 Tax=Nocardia vermiculata TaxID=257274 RepID=A0A846Y1M9_9NOCA|nr:DUF397 domain-containing protein [Nocardia vermiculata]
MPIRTDFRRLRYHLREPNRVGARQRPAGRPVGTDIDQEHSVEAKNRDIEPGAVWQRSGEGAGGVEIAFLASGNIGLRDAKNPDGPTLIFTPGEWRAFVAGAKDGEFNRPGAATA